MVSSRFSGRKASLLWLRFSQNVLGLTLISPGNRKLYSLAGAVVYFSLIQPGRCYCSKMGTGLGLRQAQV